MMHVEDCSFTRLSIKGFVNTPEKTFAIHRIYKTLCHDEIFLVNDLSVLVL